MPFERALADLSTGNVPGLTGLPHLKTLGVDGPYNATGVSETESRRRIFSCRPSGPAEEDSCAREVFSNLARRAFRRPATAGDVDRLMPLYESATGRRASTLESPRASRRFSPTRSSSSASSAPRRKRRRARTTG